MRTITDISVGIAVGYICLIVLTVLIFLILVITGVAYKNPGEYAPFTKSETIWIMIGMILACAVYILILITLRGAFSNKPPEEIGWFRNLLAFVVSLPFSFYWTAMSLCWLGMISLSFLLVGGIIGGLIAIGSGWSLYTGLTNGEPFSVWIKNWW